MLAVLAEPVSEEEPLIRIDDASEQLLNDELPPIRMTPGHPLREGYHYERNGTQALFMFLNRHSGWRRASSRDSRTHVDWAEGIRQLPMVNHPLTRKIKLVCDNLNTHGIASLHEIVMSSEA